MEDFDEGVVTKFCSGNFAKMMSLPAPALA
jgi:hypothetical protein